MTLPPHAIAALDQLQAEARVDWPAPQADRLQETLHITGYDDATAHAGHDAEPMNGPDAAR